MQDRNSVQSAYVQWSDAVMRLGQLTSNIDINVTCVEWEDVTNVTSAHACILEAKITTVLSGDPDTRRGSIVLKQHVHRYQPYREHYKEQISVTNRTERRHSTQASHLHKPPLYNIDLTTKTVNSFKQLHHQTFATTESIKVKWNSLTANLF
ncbi:hypothetical protein J6590_053539 [Homalodisca vitripennis]|nr:hypothetical protein J6590_053539 [Homalodisca vitripennis]